MPERDEEPRPFLVRDAGPEDGQIRVRVLPGERYADAPYEISVMPARGCFITVVRLTPEVAAEVAAALLDRRPTR